MTAGDPQAARRLVRALAVALAARGGRACCCWSPSSRRRRSASRSPRSSAAPGSSPRSSSPILLADKSPHGAAIVADSIFRDRWAAIAQILIAGCGVVAVLISYGERMREENVSEYYALLAAAGAGMAFFVQASNLMTLFLGLEWFSIALYVLCAIDIDLVGSLEAGLKYLIIGAVGSATLLFGSALVYGATGQLGFDKIGAAGHSHDSLLVLGLAMVIAGLAFKSSAAPFHMWTPDAYQGAPTPVTAFMASATKVAAFVVTYRLLVTAFPRERAALDVGDRRHRDRLARDRQHRRARAAERQAAARVLVGLARGLHADPDRRRERARRAGAHVLPDPVLRDVARRVRRGRRPRARARHAGDARQPGRLRLGAAVPRRLDVGLHARLPRLPAHRRLHRQVLRLRRRLPARLVVADRRSASSGRSSRPRTTSPSSARCSSATAPSSTWPRPAAHPRATSPSAPGVALCLAVTVGSFFAVQPLIDVARSAANLAALLSHPRARPSSGKYLGRGRPCNRPAALNL